MKDLKPHGSFFCRLLRKKAPFLLTSRGINFFLNSTFDRVIHRNLVPTNFIDLLIARFPIFLEAYDRFCPFKKYGQLEYHVETIRLRRALGSVEVALGDEAFQKSLYRTLQAWGIGSRASKLARFSDFVAALYAKKNDLSALDGLVIDQQGLDVLGVAKRLARLIQTLDIVENRARIVPGSKALHHLLPELVVPIDRAYTQPFFGWQNPGVQGFPEECFIDAFHSFVGIARATNPSQYVCDRWYSSRTKVLDNAVLGFWCWAKHESKPATV